MATPSAGSRLRSIADYFQTRRGFWTLAIGLGTLLFVRALELRLPEFTRPFWEDEIHHNHPVIVSPTLEAIRQHSMNIAQYQPFLDFAMRKLLWFKLFGYQERGQRLPSLIFGILLVLLVYGVAAHYLARRGWPRTRALGGAFLVGIVAATHATSIHYSAEARHYSFVALGSTLWFLLFFLYDARPAWLFALASLLYANLHFFALPVIAGGYAVVLPLALWRRQWWSLLFGAAGIFGVYWCTTHINWTPFDYLIHGPPNPDQPAVKPDLHLLLAGWRKGLELWLFYVRDLGLPLPAWAIWLGLGVAAFFTRGFAVGRVMLSVFVGLPLFFTYMRVRSTYPFGERYFSPFFGAGPASLILFLAAAAELAKRIPERRRVQVGGAALVALALLVGLPRFAWGTVADVGNIRRLPENFSPYYQIYEEVKQPNVPVFVIHNHCYCNDIVHTYMSWVGISRRTWFDTVDSLGCEIPPSSARASLQAFLSNPELGGRGMVVLDEKDNRDTDCANIPTPQIPGLKVERIQSVKKCVWKVWGARTTQEIGQVAKAMTFRASAALFQ